MSDESRSDNIATTLYYLLSQYSPDEIKAELQYCLDNPEDETVAMICISKRLRSDPKSEYCEVTHNDWKTHKTSTLDIPHSEVQGFIDGLLSKGYEPEHGTRGDLDTEYTLYYALKVARRNYA